MGMDQQDAEDWSVVLGTVALEAYGMKKSLGPAEKADVYTRAKGLIENLPPDQISLVTERIKSEMQKP